MTEEFYIGTKERYQLVDITERVEEIVSQSRVKEGLLLVFVPHSTAAVLLTENESGLKQDWVSLFRKLVSGIDFLHNRIDNNADSHLLSGLVGQGKVLPVENGRVLRGTWQRIFLAEFDGPRKRKVVLQKMRYIFDTPFIPEIAKIREKKGQKSSKISSNVSHQHGKKSIP